MVSRKDADIVVAALRAVRDLNNVAGELRQLSESLPVVYSRATKNHIRAIADRLEDSARTLGAEADRPTPSSAFLRRVAWVGPVAIAGLSGLLAGTAQGLVEQGSDPAVLEMAASLQRRVEIACDGVIASSDEASLGPPRIDHPIANTPIWSTTAVDVGESLGSKYPMLVTVRPAAEGGVWVEGAVRRPDGSVYEDARIWVLENHRWEDLKLAVRRNEEQRAPAGWHIRITTKPEGGASMVLMISQ